MNEKDKMWQEFVRTGDPSYYMMFRSLNEMEKELEKHERKN